MVEEAPYSTRFGPQSGNQYGVTTVVDYLNELGIERPIVAHYDGLYLDSNGKPFVTSQTKPTPKPTPKPTQPPIDMDSLWLLP